MAQDPSALMCQDEMKGLAHIVLTKTDVESLEKVKSQFAAAKAQAEQIKDGVTQSCFSPLERCEGAEQGEDYAGQKEECR